MTRRRRLAGLAGALVALSVTIGTTGLAQARVPTLSWSACPQAKGFRCASARVPLDYRHPVGSQIQLAVMMHRATDPHGRVRTLFLNPGGPAPSLPSFPYLYKLFPKAVQERFDIVTWDPRGLGESTPVECFSSQAAEDRFLVKTGLPVEGFPLPEFRIDASIEGFAKLGLRCLHRAGRSLLEHMSTADSARDLDLLRRASGEARMNYYGASYGTFLGDTYANLFPGRVGRMILDANVDARKWGTRRGGGFPGAKGAFLPTFLRQGSDLGAKQTLNAFLDRCGEAGTARCAFSAGSPEATRAKFAALLRRVQVDPWPGAPAYSTVVTEVVGSLYAVAAWGTLASRLEEEWNGRTPEPISAGERTHPSVAGPYGIYCGESPNPGPGAFRRVERAASQRSGLAGEYFAWVTLPCATWPVHTADAYRGPWTHRTAAPILVIGTTHDPATPYENAVEMSKVMPRARLLTADGYGHGAIVNAPCIKPYMSRYLIRGTLPAPGTRCQGEQPFLATMPSPRRSSSAG